jgi:hypothetical protein
MNSWASMLHKVGQSSQFCVREEYVLLENMELFKSAWK